MYNYQRWSECEVRRMGAERVSTKGFNLCGWKEIGGPTEYVIEPGRK
jgi:hypothetical protein